MSAKSRKRPKAYSVAIITLLLASVLSVLECVIDIDVFRAVGEPQTAWADTGMSVAAGNESTAADGTMETVRLNFFNSTWSKVLHKVAESTGSQLVIKRGPAGRFTRYDTKRYSRTDAVRILNRELEPKGFRLLEQGRFLVVLHLDALRSRYPRPRLPASERRARNAELGVANSQPNSDFSSPHRNPQSAIRNASAAESAETWNTLPAATDNRPVAVSTSRRGARQVASTIYSALKDRAELIESGPQHLPAFRVFRRAKQHSSVKSRYGESNENTQAESGVLFTVGIDIDGQKLVVEAAAEEQRNVAQLIRVIDAVEVPQGNAVQLVAIDEDTGKIVENLKPTLRSMAAKDRLVNRHQLLAQQDPTTPPRRAVAPKDPRVQAPEPGAALGQGGEPLLRMEGLRGPVTIQDVPGIGLVITGDQKDVDTVVRIIGELERLATVAVPEVHLLLLRHVNSEALSSLLLNVYDELTSIRSAGTQQRAQVAIIPVVRPNAVLLIAVAADMESILNLADKLDKPVDSRTEFEVFRLHNAIASQVITTLEFLYEQQAQQGQQQPAGLRARVKAVADARTNSVIVQAAPAELAEVARLIRKIDRDSSASISRLRVFPLENAVADELAEVINTSIQSVVNPAALAGGQGQGAGGQTTQQLRDVKSVVLEFLTTEGTAQRIIQSGILADIRVTADTRANSLIVTAPKKSMPLLEALIRHLDQPSTNVAEIKVFPLANSDATSMAQLLETLFASTDDQNQAGIQLLGAEDASSGLIPLRFSVDVRTNTIIAIGGAEALRVVEAILLRLDESDVRQRQTTVIKLKNSPAEEIGAAINTFLQSQRDLAEIDPELVSNVELLEREIIVVPELVSNSLLISATQRYYQEILDLVEKLDEAPAQVIIQVLIVEVDLQNTDEFGVELGFQDSLLFGRGVLNADTFQTITETISDPATGIQTTTETIVSQETLPGFLFNNAQLGNNTAINPQSVGKQGLSNFQLGRINGDLGFGGLVLSASSESVSLLIRALAAQRNVHILSRPQIRTVDNQLASIFVGQQVPIVSSVTTNAQGGVAPVLGTPQQVGIILQVTPRITPDGIIVMETIANKSGFAGQGVPLAVDPGTGTVIESPIFDLAEAVATVAVPDGQTIVLGGMITKTDDTIERKVPWLGDIPILGAAFRYDATSTRRTELLIFMTPRIVHNSADSELIKQVEVERLHFLEKEAEEIHGPLFAVPPETPFEEYFDPNLDPMTSPLEQTPQPNIPPLPLEHDGVPTTLMPLTPLSQIPTPAQNTVHNALVGDSAADSIITVKGIQYKLIPVTETLSVNRPKNWFGRLLRRPK